MPKKYATEIKNDALVQLSIYKNVSTVHVLTGLPKRTLYRWRKELRDQQTTGMAQKSIQNDTTASQNPHLRHNHDTNTPSTSQPRHKNAPHDTKTSALSSHNDTTVGRPGKTYPYPLEEDDITNTDNFEDFKQLRANLMEHAQQLAADLNTDDPDISLRTLALARILDRILQLDQIIPQMNPEQLIRIEYTYEGSVHNVPPWKDTDNNETA